MVIDAGSLSKGTTMKVSLMVVLMATMLCLGTPLGTTAGQQDAKDLETIAKVVRSRGFVCDHADYVRPVGLTERGEQVRLVCNAETLQYRITISPDRKRLTIKPWGE
jgi:hypothetical protein